MRLFAALTPPAEAIEHLDEFLDVRREHSELRWAQADQLHVTLAFMAQATERGLDDLTERLEAAVRRRTAFEARIVGGGAFPDVARAKILWAGLDLGQPGTMELDRLAAGARSAASRTGIVVDGARFRPHLTVARARAPHEVTRWVRLLDSYAGPTWTAAEVSLVESHLGEGPRGRPRYERIATFALG